MNQWLDDVLNGREENYMLPFFWQHGDHYDTIPEDIERIYRSGCRAFCVEARPHNDFCGDGWWRDMDRILAEAKKRGMQVWLLDDDHFPTGHANGKVKEHPELRKWQLKERHEDVIGPLTDALLLADGTDEDNILLEVFAFPRTGEEEACRAEPLRLTQGVSGDFLQFSLPAGCWRIFFLSRTRDGSLYPDYIDMLREDAVRLLIDEVYEKHYEHYAAYFGSTFAGFFSDEPCFGNGWVGSHAVDKGMYDRRLGQPGLALPWNERVTEMMREELREEPLPLLPALWYDFGAQTGEVRLAYMNAVTKLYRDCFTRQLGQWCADHGVQYIGHVIEDMNTHARLGHGSGHYFRALDGQHMSGMDVVLHQIMPGMGQYIHTASTFGNDADPAFFDCVLAKLCSSFAHIGKEMDERAMCEVFGANGWAEGAPAMKWLLDHLLVRGVNHFVPHAFSPAFPDPDCPPHFGAHGMDPQYEGFSAIMRYGNKAAHLLRHARHTADAAILYHAEAEWMNADGDAMLDQIPAKILYDADIDFDILPADCFVPGSGSRVYPAQAENGVLRVGAHRYGCLVIPWAKALPDGLTKALSTLEQSGVPVIRMEQETTAEALLATVRDVIRPRITVEDDLPLLRCARFVSGNADVFMFFNESVCDRAETVVSLPSVADTTGCIVLDLLNDAVFRKPVSSGRMALSLEPSQSVIAVFDRDVTDDGSLPVEPARIPTEPAELTFRIETAPYTNMNDDTLYAENVPASALPNITDIRAAPGFSGRIRYSCVFEAPQGVSGIELGEVGQTAKLTLNRQELGIRVCRPYRFDLSPALRDGKNELVIEVANTLANALRDGFSAFMAIPASGLLGPVHWLKEQNG